MVIMDNIWNLKEEVPTARFWLMLKLRLGWNKRYDKYTSDLKDRLKEMMTIDLRGTDADKAKSAMARHIVEKLERSAWRTLPSEFLRDMKIPRILRH